MAYASDRHEMMSWQCKECGSRQPDDRDGTRFCTSCGRPRIDIEWSRRIKRIGLILFGIAVQAAAGAMIFLIPPGASMWAWIVYLGMGLVGFLHMFIGIELTRRDAQERRENNLDQNEKARGFQSVGFAHVDTLAEALPHHARRCPSCDHSLIETIDRRRRICPECGEKFNLRNLGYVADDPAGELHAASPHESRLSGGVLVTALLAAAIIAGFILITLLTIAGTGGAPAPGP